MVKRKTFNNHQETPNLNSNKPKALIMVLLSLVVVLALVQIYLSGKVAVMGDKLRVLEQKKEELILENARLQDKINIISSLTYIEKKAQEDLKMQSGINSAWYLSVSDTLASR